MQLFLQGLEKFIVTLIKSIFFAWIGLFMLVTPLMVAAHAAFGSSDFGAFLNVNFWPLVALFTGVIFFLVWKRPYADKFASWGAVLRMKWNLRGVGRD